MRHILTCFSLCILVLLISCSPHHGGEQLSPTLQKPTETSHLYPTAALNVPSPSPSVQPSASPSLSSLTSSPSPTATLAPSPTPSPKPSPPKVLRSYPIDGDQAVQKEWPLVLIFDRPMDAASVATHLQISPHTELHLRWLSPQRLECLPTQGWQENTWYSVQLLPGARDLRGIPLEESFSLHFRRGGPGVPLPILMYHHIAQLGKEASAGQRRWTVSPQAFSQQMDYLSSHGWQSISPEELVAYLTKGEPLPPRAILITIDDGYKEIYDLAYPIFQKTGLRPVLFIVPKYIGCGAYLSWEQLQELADQGFWIGAHGYDHSDLRRVSDKELEHQLGDSRRLLEEKLGIPVRSFCYPYGSYDARILAGLRTHGYVAAFTLNPSCYQQPGEPYRLSRLRVSYEMTLAEFTQLLPR